VVEMTNRGDHALEVFSELERYCRKAFPTLMLGVGSIVDAPTAALYIAAGAAFVVGPSLDRETALLCNKRKIPYLPGCGSMTEISAAHELGVEICKIFPGASVGGPDFVRAVKAPCPWTSFMPTGGVNPTRESLEQWFTAGITAAGIGSKLISKDLVKAKDYKAITENVRRTLDLIADIKKKPKS
jgi:2-dehydro-3-deoxyphosphogluconate aldolase/(4S)-4-hydroxy-2-oxoglutarate aldolase